MGFALQCSSTHAKWKECNLPLVTDKRPLNLGGGGEERMIGVNQTLIGSGGSSVKG
jgi:hypothetical protein